MPLPVSLPEVLESHADARMQDVHVACPAQIVSWSGADQTATVQPMVRKPLVRPDGQVVYQTLPQIKGVPVMTLRGGGYMVSMPMAAGDGVMLIFSEQSYSEWRATGIVSSPRDVRRHGVGYPFAIPGIQQISKALASASGANLVLGRDGNNELITISPGSIAIGNGGQPVPTKADYSGLLAALSTFFGTPANFATTASIGTAAGVVASAIASGSAAPVYTTMVTLK